MVERVNRRQEIISRRPPDGGWELVSGRPAPRLRSLVHGYEGYREALAAPMQRRELPSARVAVIINFGPSYRLLDPKNPGNLTRAVEHRGGFVAGLDDAFAITESAGAAHCLQIDLEPLGAYRLFGRPMSELARRVVSLDDLLGAEAGLLTEQLLAFPSWERRFAHLDALLAGRLADAPAPSPEIAWAWRQLAASGGRVTIATLRDELGWSPKRLITCFREQVGLPPKQAARLLRFQRAVAHLRARDIEDWGTFAQEHGYYDQSHLIAEFRRFAGDTPEGVARRRLPADGGFAND